MGNEVLNVIRTRRSVRKFRKEPLPEETLRAILDAGRQAPSGGNCQYNHFLVIRSEKVLERLNRVAEKLFSAMEFDANTYKSIKSAILTARKGNYCFHYHAPVLVVVANRIGHGNGMADAAIALENMMLAAKAVGAGSCWINQLRWLRDEEEIRAELIAAGMDEGETVMGAVALGIPDEPDRPAPEITGNRVTFVD